MASGQLLNGDPSGSARGSGFRTTPDIPTSFSSRRIPYSDSPIDGSLGTRSSTLGGYGFSSAFGSSQSPWSVPSSNFGSAYEGIGPSRDSQEHLGLQNLANQGLGINYGTLRSSQEPIVDSSLPTSLNYGPDTRMLVGDHQYGTFDIATGAGDPLFPHEAPQVNNQNQQVLSIDSLYTRNGGFTSSQNNDPSQQLSWPDTTEKNVPRNVPINDHPLATANTTVQTLPTLPESLAWDRPTQPLPPIPRDASPWVVATHGPVDKAWGEDAESGSMADKTEAEVEPQPSPVDPVSVASTGSDVLEEAKPKSEIVELPAPTIAAKPSGKSRKQKELKVSALASQPLQPPQPEIASPEVSASKPVWQKEDEAKKTISLREIQEAEVQKAGVKKAVERERERVARVATQDKEPQTFTTSWGLPTSQAGSRSIALPVKETAPASVPPAAAPVWTNVSKLVPAKKTMKEILEEEEKRKKAVSQTTAAATLALSGSRRAESSAKVLCLVLAQ